MRLANELYATGAYSHRAQAAEMDRRGIPTATGRGKWWVKTAVTELPDSAA